MDYEEKVHLFLFVSLDVLHIKLRLQLDLLTPRCHAVLSGCCHVSNNFQQAVVILLRSAFRFTRSKKKIVMLQLFLSCEPVVDVMVRSGRLPVQLRTGALSVFGLFFHNLRAICSISHMPGLTLRGLL